MPSVADLHPAEHSDTPTRRFGQTFRGVVSGITVLWMAAAVSTVTASFFWLGDLVANLRVQMMLAGTGLTLALIALRKSRMLLLVVIAMGVMGAGFRQTRSLSAISLDGSTGSASEVITVMAANVYTRNRRFDEIVRQFQASKADVISISELSPELDDHLQRTLADRLPHRITFPAGAGNFGIGLYSRYPLENSSIEFLTGDGIPTAVADVSTPQGPIHVVAVHTLPPLRSEAFRHRNQQLAFTAQHVQQKRQQQPDVPTVVMGDLNLTPWSPCFDRFLQDARLWRTTSGGTGLQPTWYPLEFFPLGLVLDHVLISDNLQTVNHSIGPDAGSDHRFVTVRLRRN